MGLGMRRTTTSTEQSERRPLTARNSEIDTKTRLLDDAERLFSDRSFEAVFHRDIAVAAALNLAAVNYHLVLRIGSYGPLSREGSTHSTHVVWRRGLMRIATGISTAPSRSSRLARRPAMLGRLLKFVEEG
jgi:hypothetical protein